MSFRLLLLLVARELRGARSRVTPFVASLAVGVAAVVLVAGLADSVERAIRMEARPLLGADVAARSFEPIPESYDALATQFPTIDRADTVDFLTMVAVPAEGAPGKSLLAELKAVSPNWPFYGAPVLDPEVPLASLLVDNGAVVDPALLERLGVQVGDSLHIGATTVTIRGLVTREPGRLPTGLVAGPRVFISLDTLPATGLGMNSARTTFRALFHAPEEADTASLLTALKADASSPWMRIETWSDAQPSAQRTIERSRSWLGLVALLSLVVGGVGVAQSTRAHLARRLDGLAIQRCLGMTPREILLIALTETAVLALVGSSIGALLGVAVLAVAPAILGDLLPAGAVVPWQPGAMMRGAGLGLGIALLFAAEPVARASRVPPLRVLRRDVEPLPNRPVTWIVGAASLTLGVFSLAWLQSGDLIVAASFAGGLLVVAAVGTLGAETFTRVLARAARSARTWWLRHGLAAPARPGAGTIPAVVSLALGVVVVATTVLVEARLQAQIGREVPLSAPSAFFLDVQPDQRAEVEGMVAEAGGERIRGAPVVVARLLSVDGQSVDTLAAARPDADRWSLTREQRLSYRPDLPPDNTIVAGAPFTVGGVAEVSLEQRYAESLGAEVGSTVEFDVQGVPLSFLVANIRTVEWESFDINFFMIMEPGPLDAAPQTVLMTATLPAEAEPALQDQLAAALPNVTLLSVRNALQQVQGLLGRVALGIRVVGAFTALAGISILVSGVAADASRRGREVALLKTLGTTQPGVIGMLAVEYALVGFGAGVLGFSGAWVTSRVIVERLLQLDWAMSPLFGVATVAACAALCAVAGVTANLRAVRARPAEVLRG